MSRPWPEVEADLLKAHERFVAGKAALDALALARSRLLAEAVGGGVLSPYAVGRLLGMTETAGYKAAVRAMELYPEGGS